MDADNIQDACQFLLVETEFSYENNSYRIDEVNIGGNYVKCYKFNGGTIHTFNNLSEINATIEHCLNN